MLIFDQLKRNDRSLWVIALGVLAGIVSLLSGLYYHQIISSHRYVRSQKNQSFRTVRVPALRGRILDSQGVVLAENRPAYNVNLYVEELSERFKEAFRQAKGKRKLSFLEMLELGRKTRYLVASNMVNQLAGMLNQPLTLDESTFNSHYTNRLVLPLPILSDLPPGLVARFMELPNKPPGFNLEIQPLRIYPQGTRASHVLGYLARAENYVSDDEISAFYCLPDYEGKVGIEAAFDEVLRGRAGLKSVMVNSIGYRQSENIWTPADPGWNVVLTIDLRLQKAAEQAMRGVGPEVLGAVVVLNATNGDILALVSSPDFNPNTFIPLLHTEDSTKLYDPDLKPMVNRATFGAYAPGSIFKIIIALAGLESGELDPNEVFQSKGYFQLGRGKPFADTAPAGEYNFRRAFKLSSNSYFINYGLRTGLTNIMRMGRRFFLGQRTGVPLFQEVSGFLPTPEWVQHRKEEGEVIQPGDVANLSIGQGYLTVTPLQMALMTAAIANGGKVFWPRLVQRLEPPELKPGAQPKAFPAGRIRGELNLRPQTQEVIREAMLADVEDADGTGRQAAIEGWRVCGKTGTAQVKQNGRVTRKDVWFVSYAPYESPRYVVVVVVEGGNSGAGTCAPVARRIFEAIRQSESPASVLKIAAQGRSSHE
jgi:penicillin-binding protein 2